ncbi:hypothetical protein BV22DRAFT_971471, partial [Leucogyrophana mollusca]
FDSPRTFGYPTPPENRSTFAFPSPPPPMPALDHPELTAALSSRMNRPDSAPRPSSSAGGSKTLPYRRSKITPRTRDDFFSSLSQSFGHSIRHHSSLPRVHQIFPSSASDERQRLRGEQRPRARTVSGKTKHVRRSSADWSAHQATVGVNSTLDYGWPAEVSRQILRLSLGK